MYDLARVERHHRANQRNLAYTLIRKRYGCGKQVTARQLGQYGRCVSYVRGRP